MNAGGGGTTHLYLWWEELRREHYAQLGWNDVAQWHVDEDAASSPFGLNRWLDWGMYHAGGLDSLPDSTRWVQSPAEQDDYAATEVFFVRDHLGSTALAMQAKRTLVSGETYRWELQPVESYEYAPYGDPTIHVPATDGSPQSAGRLALKAFETFSMSGAKSSDALLDRNDVGRPNGSTGNTWTRSGAVPVAKSFLAWSHLFTGRPWDADVRQYYIRHRWYEPLTGRWTSVDPIGYGGGINQYQYCAGNPANFKDPFGAEFILITIRECGPAGDDWIVGHVGIEFLTDDLSTVGAYGLHPDPQSLDLEHNGKGYVRNETYAPEFYDDHFRGTEKGYAFYIPTDEWERERKRYENLSGGVPDDPSRPQPWGRPIPYNLRSNNCVNHAGRLIGSSSGGVGPSDADLLGSLPPARPGDPPVNPAFPFGEKKFSNPERLTEWLKSRPGRFHALSTLRRRIRSHEFD